MDDVPTRSTKVPTQNSVCHSSFCKVRVVYSRGLIEYQTEIFPQSAVDLSFFICYQYPWHSVALCRYDMLLRHIFCPMQNISFWLLWKIAIHVICINFLNVETFYFHNFGDTRIKGFNILRPVAPPYFLIASLTQIMLACASRSIWKHSVSLLLKFALLNAVLWWCFPYNFS